MSDPHLHPVGSCRMGAMEQCPLLWGWGVASGRQKSASRAQISLQMLCNTCPSSWTRFIFSTSAAAWWRAAPSRTSSSFPHILHTFHVLMTPKRRFFFATPLFPLLILYFPSVCKGVFFSSSSFFGWADQIANIPGVIISESILFWMSGRKLGAGKQRRAPHQDLFFLFTSLYLEVRSLFVIRSARASLRSWRWNSETSAVVGASSQRFVCSIQCPWTSLACVLIKSLLVIPGGARWDSSHVISPRSVSGSLPRFLSSSTCPLNFPQSQAPHQSFDGELRFLFSRWRAGALVCRCETDKGETIKADFATSLSDGCHISVPHVSLCNFSKWLHVRCLRNMFGGIV